MSLPIEEKHVRVILADDQELVRSGIRSMIKDLKDYEIVAEAADGISTLSAVSEYLPDVLLLDMQMPTLGGMEVLKRLSKEDNSPLVLVVSASEPGLNVSEALKSGASGYITKNASKEEFELALKTIVSGKKYVSPSIASHANNTGSSENPILNLSEREREIFKLLAEGKKNKEVAKVLFISPRTVDTHRLNIMKKLGLATNGELVQLAIRYSVL